MPLLPARHVSVPPHIIRHHTILVPKIQTPSSDPIYGPLPRPLIPPELLPAFTDQQAKVITAIRREASGLDDASSIHPSDVEIRKGEEIGPLSHEEWVELKEAVAENLRRASAGYENDLTLISALLKTDEDHMPIEGKRAWFPAAQEAIMSRVLDAQFELLLLDTAEAESGRLKVWKKDVEFEVGQFAHRVGSALIPGRSSQEAYIPDIQNASPNEDGLIQDWSLESNRGVRRDDKI